MKEILSQIATVTIITAALSIASYYGNVLMFKIAIKENEKEIKFPPPTDKQIRERWKSTMNKFYGKSKQ